MAISDSIAQTIRRIGIAGGILGGPTIRKLWQGLSKDFGRVWDYLGLVESATVPSPETAIETLSDLEAKYGIQSLGGMTDEERIARLVERASQYGSGGAGWLQQQIQAAGFPLYVLENVAREEKTFEHPIARYDASFLSEFPNDTSGVYYRLATPVINSNTSLYGIGPQINLTAYAGQTIDIRYIAKLQPGQTGEWLKLFVYEPNWTWNVQYSIPADSLDHFGKQTLTLPTGYTTLLAQWHHGPNRAHSGTATISDWYIGTGAYLTGSLIDISDNGNDATVYGATPVDGISGKALSFDGVNDRVSLPNSNVFKPTEEVSVSAWIKIDSTTDHDFNYVLLCGRNLSSGYMLYYHKGDGKIYAKVWGSSAVTVSSAIAANTWHHVAFTYKNGTGLTLYLDGAQVATGGSVGAITYTQLSYGYPTIGSHGLLYYFKGIIDETLIFSRAISVEEVRWLSEHPGYLPAYGTQFGNVQFDETTQFGTMPSRIDPSTVPGILITSSPNRPGSGVISPSSQFGGATQFGGTTQFGTLDEDYIYPQPAERGLLTDPTQWGGVFFLSPFPDRVAAPSEMLYMADEKVQYLIKIVTAIKYLGRWCVAQVAVVP